MNSPRHTVAAGILVERGDEVLQVRTERRGWEFPGGQIEEGESVLDGVIREVREEANIVASADRLVGVYSNLSYCRVIFDFRGSWLSGDARIGEETLDVSWVQKADAIKMIDHLSTAEGFSSSCHLMGASYFNHIQCHHSLFVPRSSYRERFYSTWNSPHWAQEKTSFYATSRSLS